MNINLDNNPNKETLCEEQCFFAFNVALLIKFIYDHGHYCTFGEAYRTPEQAALYAKEDKGIVDSLHCKRLAIDLNLFKQTKMVVTCERALKNAAVCTIEEYRPIGQYWKGLDSRNKWGGDFIKNGKPWPDIYHFEMHI